MLNNINLENLGVTLVKQGSYMPSDLVMKLLFLTFSVILCALSALFLNRCQVLLKDKKLNLSILNFQLFSIILCFTFVFFLFFSFFYSSKINPTTELQYLREDEFIIELTETSDLSALTTNYSVYYVENSLVAREGRYSCSDSWKFFNRVDGLNNIDLSKNSLIEVSLNNLGVTVVEQGTNENSFNIALFTFVVLLMFFVGFYIYGVSSGREIPKKVTNSLNIISTIIIFGFLLSLLFNLFTGFPYNSFFGIHSFGNTKTLSDLRTDEYIIEFNENADYGIVSDNFSVYELEGKIVLRDGFATNSWNYTPKTSELLSKFQES